MWYLIVSIPDVCTLTYVQNHILFLVFLLFQFLQKVYREDLDELVDEADYEMYKYRKAAKETETEFKKKILTGIKPSQNVDSKKPGNVYSHVP